MSKNLHFAPMKLRILLVAATAGEAAGLADRLGMGTQTAGTDCREGELGVHDISLQLTGIGMVNTAAHLASLLARRPFHLAINLGICGSYVEHSPGTVVEIAEELYGDLGATDAAGRFLDLGQLGFPLGTMGGRPYYNQLVNPRPSSLAVPKVRGLTANTVAGDAALIAQRWQRWQPEVETMESAAFFQLCLEHRLPFYAFRAVSNAVAGRDRNKWEIPLAIQKLEAFLLTHLMHLADEAETGL